MSLEQEFKQLRAQAAARFKGNSLRIELSRLDNYEILRVKDQNRLGISDRETKKLNSQILPTSVPAKSLPAPQITDVKHDTIPSAPLSSGTPTIGVQPVRLPDLTQQAAPQPRASESWDAIVGEANVRNAKAHGFR